MLFLSAFVLSSPWSLWTMPLIVAVLGSVQGWLGRTATVLVGLVGHVLATVFVAVLLQVGIARHPLDRSLAQEPDVGLSYVLAAVWGLLLFRAAPACRRRTGLLVCGGLTAVVLVSETFTDLGHLVAWLTGAGFGFIGTQMQAARLDHVPQHEVPGRVS